MTSVAKLVLAWSWRVLHTILSSTLTHYSRLRVGSLQPFLRDMGLEWLDFMIFIPTNSSYMLSHIMHTLFYRANKRHRHLLFSDQYFNGVHASLD